MGHRVLVIRLQDAADGGERCERELREGGHRGELLRRNPSALAIAGEKAAGEARAQDARASPLASEAENAANDVGRPRTAFQLVEVKQRDHGAAPEQHVAPVVVVVEPPGRKRIEARDVERSRDRLESPLEVPEFELQRRGAVGVAEFIDDRAWCRDEATHVVFQQGGRGRADEAVGHVVKLGEPTSCLSSLFRSREVEVLALDKLEESPREPLLVHHDGIGGPRLDGGGGRDPIRLEVPLEAHLEPHALGIAIAPIPPQDELTPARVDDSQVVVAGARVECADKPRLVECVTGEHLAQRRRWFHEPSMLLIYATATEEGSTSDGGVRCGEPVLRWHGRGVMEPSETARLFWPYIARSIGRIIAALGDLEDAGVHLDWRPPAANANSVYVLAVHALGTTEHRLLSVLCGIDVDRDRDGEFAAAAGSALVIADRWREIAARITKALDTLTEADLRAVRRHPERGAITGLDVLIVVARHMAEHAGQAELTRDLALASTRT